MGCYSMCVTHMVQDLAFCGVVFLCNSVCHSTCAYKQGIPVVGAEKEVKCGSQ